MTAKDMLIGKSTLVHGTASTIFKAIEAGLVYNGEVRYIYQDSLVDGVASVMASNDMRDNVANIDVFELDSSLDIEVLSADIKDSDEE